MKTLFLCTQGLPDYDRVDLPPALSINGIIALNQLVCRLESYRRSLGSFSRDGNNFRVISSGKPLKRQTADVFGKHLLVRPMCEELSQTYIVHDVLAAISRHHEVDTLIVVQSPSHICETAHAFSSVVLRRSFNFSNFGMHMGEAFAFNIDKKSCVHSKDIFTLETVLSP